MVTMVILLIGLLGTFQLIEVANSRGAGNRAREGATNLAREVLEQTRTIPFAQVSTASSVDVLLQGIAGLSDDNASLPGWQVTRRGFTYGVVVTACAFDDPKDGGGAHDASSASFCSDSTPVDTADSQPQDLKRVTAAVSFTERGRTTTVRMTGTLNSSGRAVGMPVTDLRVTDPVLSQPTQPLITSTSVSSLTFRATLPAAASGAVWLLDGQAMTPVPVRAANGTNWTFSWSITGVSDGPYQVSVQALDAVGLPGPPRTITVRLLRSLPAAPTGVTGGFNDVNRDGSSTPVVELRWFANSERNVEGYRVYNPSGQLVCETARIIDTECIDFNPPAQSASNLTYTVRALFRDVNDNLQQGPAAPFTLQTSLLQRFGFRATTANTLTKCGGVASTRKDMVSGYAGVLLGALAGPGVSTGSSINFCSDPYRAGDTIPPGTTTVVGKFNYGGANGANKGCSITATYGINGTGATLSAPNTVKSSSLYKWSFSTPATVVLAAGDRINVRFDWASTNGDCAKTDLSYGSSPEPGHLDVSSTTNLAAAPPDPPSSVTGVTQPDGTVNLSWTAPAGGSATFYRIYRDGSNYTQRIDSTGSATETSYVDTKPSGLKIYYVTSVNKYLGESDPVQAVIP
jgi:hypothetical protein